MSGAALRGNRAAPRRLCAALGVAGIALLAAMAPPAYGQPASPSRPAAAPAAPIDVSGLIHVCSSCHGFEGRNDSSSFPNLAGEPKQFLVTELEAMRDHKRADAHVQTYMWGMTARLTNPQIEGIADYYSHQAPAAGAPNNSPQVAAGRAIYLNGIPARSVPACQTCHGAQAQGRGPFPRLAGQHAQYVARELGEFASGQRANPVMHENSKNLSPAEIEAVAAYLATL